MDTATATTTPLPYTHESTEAILDAYDALLTKCYQASQRDGAALMGKDRWLANAINESDLCLASTPEGIRCSGSTYTSQTMDHEWFDFTIPFEALKGE